MIKITVKNRKTLAENQFQFKKNIITVGRSRQNDVCIESETVSRHHCQFHIGNNEIFLEDLGSGNGTLLNNKLIKANEKIQLKKEDAIRIEDFVLEWQTDIVLPQFQADSPLDSTDPDILEMKMIKKVIGSMSTSHKPQIIFLSEPFKNKTLNLDDPQKTYIIGREADCSLVLDSPILSRKHAEITNKWGTFVIRDLQSKNGTFVNGVPATEEISLHDKDKIVLGTLEAEVHFPQNYNFSEIEKSLQEEKKRSSKNSSLEDSSSFSQRLVDVKPQAIEDPKKHTPQKETASTVRKDSPNTPEIKTDSPPEPPKDSPPHVPPTAPAQEKTENEPAPQIQTPKKPSALTLYLKSLKSVEWILLSFAILVVLVVLYALKAIIL